LDDVDRRDLEVWGQPSHKKAFRTRHTDVDKRDEKQRII